MKKISHFVSVLIAAFALSILFGAPTFAADSVSITVGDSPNITLERNTLGTASVDVFVTSTATNGYTLSLTDSDEDNSLKSQFGDAINPLSTSSTADNFGTNSWGVKVGSNYLPVPKLSDEAIELYKSTTTAENEKTTATPEEVMAMAKSYRKPDLCNYFCTHECAIGKEWVPPIREKPIEAIVLEMLDTLNNLEKDRNRLIEITSDGVIHDDQIADFVRVRSQLERMRSVVDSLRLWFDAAVAQGSVNVEILNDVLRRTEE